MSNEVRTRVSAKDDASKTITNVRDLWRKFQREGSEGVKAGLSVAVAVKGFMLLDSAIAGVTQKFFESIQAASGLEQSVGAVDSVFGTSAGVIEKWGKTAANAAGLSKREVNEMAAVTGAQLQGMGFELGAAAEQAIVLQKRAADMAATFGGPTKDAMQAISALMRGERDPIERYGVSIKAVDVNARIMALGLDTSTAAARKNAEAVAGLDLLMEQTAKTEGQFARESESLAGTQARLNAKLENLAATLGEKAIPLAIKMAEAGIALADAVEDLLPAFETAGKGMSFFLEKGGEFLDFVHGVPPTVKRDMGMVPKHIEDLTPAVGDAAGGMGKALSDGVEEGHDKAVRIARQTPGDIAAALRDKREVWQDAVDLLGDDLKSEMSQAAEAAKVRGELAGKNLARGLKSADPRVRAQAQHTKNILEARLRELEGDARHYGSRTGRAYGDGLRSSAIYVSQAARTVAAAAGKILKASSPPGPESPLHEIDKWGERTAEAWGDGMVKGIGKVKGGIRSGLGGMAPAFGGGAAATPAGGATVGHLELHVHAAPGMTPGAARELGEALGPAVATYLQKRRLIPA